MPRRAGTARWPSISFTRRKLHQTVSHLIWPRTLLFSQPSDFDRVCINGHRSWRLQSLHLKLMIRMQLLAAVAGPPCLPLAFTDQATSASPTPAPAWAQPPCPRLPPAPGWPEPPRLHPRSRWGRRDRRSRTPPVPGSQDRLVVLRASPREQLLPPVTPPRHSCAALTS